MCLASCLSSWCRVHQCSVVMGDRMTPAAQTPRFLLRVSVSSDLIRRALCRHFQIMTAATRTAINAPSIEYDTTSCAVMLFSMVSSFPNGHIVAAYSLTLGGITLGATVLSDLRVLFAASQVAHLVLTRQSWCHEVLVVVNLVDFCRFEMSAVPIVWVFFIGTCMIAILVAGSVQHCCS